MVHLYRFICEPNYHVVRFAELIFYTEDYMVPDVALKYAQELAGQEGINYPEISPVVTYLGKVSPSDALIGKTGIIMCVTGEH